MTKHRTLMIGVAVQDQSAGSADEMLFVKARLSHIEQQPQRLDPGLRALAHRELDAVLDNIEGQLRQRHGVPVT